MELTINNLIKMIIAVIVIVLVVAALYFAMKSYIIPYFKGISFGIKYVLIKKMVIN